VDSWISPGNENAVQLPKEIGTVVQGVVLPTVFVILPIELSRRGDRRGWSGGRPGPMNLLGLLLLAAGAALFAWAVLSHRRTAATPGWEVSLAPAYLVDNGPYRFTRNPMYIGEAAIWAGWALFFGSWPVTGGLMVLTMMQTGAVRLEEHALHRRLGDRYDAYRERVPRLIPRG
jgi:protein-S-isoprenylcysteine O-methyltransferase Ste14